MPTINSAVLSLLDWAKRLDPDGKTARIAELLQQLNQVVEDVHWEEGNLPTGHMTTIRTGLPTVYWRMINQGVPPSKSHTAQVTEQAAIMESRSQIDKALAELGGEVGKARLKEAMAFVEAMTQEFAQTLFYGNSGLTPEEFTGLAPRYSAISGAANASHVLSAGGSGSDNTSIWLVVWGPSTVFGIFPRGSAVGLVHEDLGLGDAFDASGNRFRAYMDRWEWRCGLVVADWRYTVRICNIDVSNLVGESSAADLFKLMIKATHRIPNLSVGRPVFYMNRSVFQMLDIQARTAVLQGGQLRYDVVDGKRITLFREIPVRICDQILETEAVVS